MKSGDRVKGRVGSHEHDVTLTERVMVKNDLIYGTFSAWRIVEAFQRKDPWPTVWANGLLYAVHESCVHLITETGEHETSTGHWDGYPHNPGTLYDCPDCESQCFCDNAGDCLFCEIEAAPSKEYMEEC